MPTIERSVLPNGVTVISENLPGQVASLGLWFREGSSAETGVPGGICHVLEHMLFKGTSRHTAFGLSAEIEGRGGLLNAATGRCDTSLYCSLPAGDWEPCLDLLAEMIRDSRLDAEDLERELSVIVDEIRMVAESPEDELGDLLYEDLYPGQAFGRPVQGDEASVAAIDRGTLTRFHDRLLRGRNLVLACSGPVAHAALVRRAEALFGDLRAGEEAHSPCPEPVQPGRVIHRRAAALQAHLQVMRPGPVYGSEDYGQLAFLNTLLGEGMSSRLFVELREERALCYSIFSWLDLHERCSLLGVYLACDESRLQEARALLAGELSRLADKGPTEEEVLRTRRQLLGALAIADEQSGNRLQRLARRELARLEPLDSAQIAARLGARSREPLADCARRWLQPEGFHESVIIGEDT